MTKRENTRWFGHGCSCCREPGAIEAEGMSPGGLFASSGLAHGGNGGTVYGNSCPGIGP